MSRGHPALTIQSLSLKAVIASVAVLLLTSLVVAMATWPNEHAANPERPSAVVDIAIYSAVGSFATLILLVSLVITLRLGRAVDRIVDRVS